MKRNRLLLPYTLWMTVFTLIPLGVVVFYAFTDSLTGAFTFENLSHLGTYLPIFLRSIFLSLASSAICLVIGYPVAYTIARATPSRQRLLSMLVMLPMCMSFLLRTLAWVAMLEDTGILNSWISALGLKPLPLIRNSGAVILGMVYNYLPHDFCVFPGNHELFSPCSSLTSTYFRTHLHLGCAGGYWTIPHFPKSNGSSIAFFTPSTASQNLHTLLCLAVTHTFSTFPIYPFS